MPNQEKQGKCPVGIRTLEPAELNHPHQNPLLVSYAESSEPDAKPVIEKPAENEG